MRNDRPLKREGTVEDVAEAALYFATDRSRYVTGNRVADRRGHRRGQGNRPEAEAPGLTWAAETTAFAVLAGLSSPETVVSARSVAGSRRAFRPD